MLNTQCFSAKNIENFNKNSSFNKRLNRPQKDNFRQLLNVFWFVTLIYCIPFYLSINYMLVTGHNFLFTMKVSLFLLFFSYWYNIKNLIYIILLGFVFAFLLKTILPDNIIMETNKFSYISILCMLFSFVIGSIFRNKYHKKIFSFYTHPKKPINNTVKNKVASSIPNVNNSMNYSEKFKLALELYKEKGYFISH